MSYHDFYKDIKNNSIAPMYLFFGQEKYMIKSALETAFSAIVQTEYEDFNYSVIDAHNTCVNDVIGAAETMPLFAKRKMVVVKNTSYFKSQKSGVGLNEENSLIEYFNNPASTTVLFFILEDKPDKRRSLYKKFTKNGSVIEFGKLDKNAFPKWIVKTLKSHGKSIETDVLANMIQDTGYLDYGSSKRLYDVINELNQLVSYVGSRDRITQDDLNAIWRKSIEKSIFHMVDALGYKNMPLAFTILEKLIYEAEPPVKILVLIARHYRNLFKIKIYDNQGYSPSVMASKLKLPPFILKKQLSQTKNYSRRELSLKLNQCLNTEYALKTGKMNPKLILEILMIKLCKGNNYGAI